MSFEEPFKIGALNKEMIISFFDGFLDREWPLKQSKSIVNELWQINAFLHDYSDFRQGGRVLLLWNRNRSGQSRKKAN